MAAVEEITCLTCGSSLQRTLMICPHCGKNPRKAPRVAATVEHSATETGSFVLVFPNWLEVGIAEGEIVEVGRECGNDAIDEALRAFVDVSRRHAAFSLTADGLRVTDFGRDFGTFVGGERLEAGIPTLIEPGHVVRLGRDCHVKVRATDG